MLRLRFFEVRDVDRLRAWMRELHERRDEVLETFAQETVRHEAVFLLDTSDGPVCAYAIEAEDLERAYRVVRENPFPIDIEHQAVMRDVLGDEIDVEQLLDERAP